MGVHLLNLLALPAIVLVYYFRKNEFTWKGFVISITLSFIILALIMWGLIPGAIKISTRLDLLFVNSFGLPANSGMIFHAIVLAVLFVLAIRSTLVADNKTRTGIYSILALSLSGIWIVSGSGLLNILIVIAIGSVIWLIGLRSRSLLNTVLTSTAVILIGYSSNAIVVIRSSANPPLNENNPSNPFNLLYFLNREQYGSRPLIRGQYYNAPVVDYKEGKPSYALEDGKYVITNRSMERVFDERFLTLFPRMWSDQEDHAEIYREWGGSKGTPLQVTGPDGKRTTVRKPTFGENLKFMFSYQVGYMYFRYFMWNFSGRQNDTQGTGGSANGNWMTGIDFLDARRIGTSDIPESMAKDKSRNKYYLLPLLLGLTGLFFQLNRDNKNWWNIFLLFLMTGLAIVFYLNQYPNQPRERDYAYVGSFYFFAVWIGMGVVAIYEVLSKYLGEKVSAPLSGVVCLFAVPVLMGLENWDDHDRSGRYLTRDVAANYLNTCAPGAILFTNGDNDTFPLWYAQEVEGIRTDIRVCNLMLLNTDWYIDQMKRKVYESDPLPVSLPVQKYYDGINNQVYIVEKTKDPVDISTVIEWVKSENKATKVQVAPNELLDIIPARTIRIPVDRQKVIASGLVSPEDSSKIVPYIDISLKGSAIIKSQLMVLDILANNDWERPVYFVTGYHEDAMGLEEYFQLEGLAYRLVPVRSENKGWTEYGRIDTKILYDNMVNKFAWGGANDPDVNIDYNHYRTLIVVRARLNYARLAKALAEEGKKDLAINAIDHCLEVLPLENVPYDPYVPDIIEACFAAGDTARAVVMTQELCNHYYADLDYYLKQDPYIIASAEYEIQAAIQYPSRVANACRMYGQAALADEITAKLEDYYTGYVMSLREPAR